MSGYRYNVEDIRLMNEKIDILTARNAKLVADAEAYELMIVRLNIKNEKLVAALEKIAKLEGIQSESGRIACKALLNQ